MLVKHGIYGGRKSIAMSILAVAAAFAAGLTTSVGPCVAPRYLASDGYRYSGSNGFRGAGRASAALWGGLLACYALLASTASLH